MAGGDTGAFSVYIGGNVKNTTTNKLPTKYSIENSQITASGSPVVQVLLKKAAVETGDDVVLNNVQLSNNNTAAGSWTGAGILFKGAENVNASINNSVIKTAPGVNNAAMYLSSNANGNTINVNASHLIGNVVGGVLSTPTATTNISNNVNINNKSTLDGNVTLFANTVGTHTLNVTFGASTFNGGASFTDDATGASVLNLGLSNGSTWNVTRASNVSSLDLTGNSTINLGKNTATVGTLSQSAGIGNITSSGGVVNVTGTASGTYNLSAASSGREGVNRNYMTYLTAGSNVKIQGAVEQGVYQYDAKTAQLNTTQSVAQMVKTNRLSNSASTVLGLAAAPVNIANLVADTLDQRLDAAHRNNNDRGGVWASYFGGKNKNTTSAGAQYDLETNGIMIGSDTSFAASNGKWLAGVAVSSASSDLSSMSSKGSLDGYNVQGYLSRAYDNGFFVNTTAQFGHYTTEAKVNMLDGQKATSNKMGTNGFGFSMKGGYTYTNQNFFAEPYVKATAMAFDGASYTLSNGMTVESNDLTSMQGEVGATAGYTHKLANNGFVKPFVRIAGIEEFADSNTVKVNGIELNNSVDGAAVRVGAGVQMQATKNFGLYTSFDFTKGGDIERPWQATAGVNYIW